MTDDDMRRASEEASAYARRDRLEQIAEALLSSQWDSTVNGVRRVSTDRNGRAIERNLKGLSVPSRRGADEGQDDGTRDLINSFLDTYWAPSESKYRVRGNDRLWSEGELREIGGMVPNNAQLKGAFSDIIGDMIVSGAGNESTYRSLAGLVSSNPASIISRIPARMRQRQGQSAQRADEALRRTISSLTGGGGSGGRGGGGNSVAGAGDNDDPFDNPESRRNDKRILADWQREQREEETAERAKEREEKRRRKESKRGLKDAQRIIDRADKVNAGILEDIAEDEYSADKNATKDQKRKAKAAHKERLVKVTATGDAVEAFGKAMNEAWSSGVHVGNAVGNIAQGMLGAIGNAAGAFGQVGQAILGQILAPLGPTGPAVAAIAGTIGKTVIAGVSTVGGFAVAGLKIGTTLAAGIAAGLGVAGTTAIGAAVGSIVPGVGTIVGAGIGATLGGGIAKAIGDIAGTIGGAFGQLFNSIGDAFGQLGSALSDTIGHVGSALKDMIQAGRDFSGSILGIQRNSGMSLASSSQWGALAQIVGGSPGSLNQFFSSFASMAPYLAQRAAYLGAPGVNPANPASYVMGLYNRYEAYGDSPQGALQRRILLNVGFSGASDQFGQLFSMGRGGVMAALAAAQQTALSPREVQQDAQLGLQLDIIQAKLNKLKLTFLTDLMPVIEQGLTVFSKFFTNNESSIVTAMQNVGKWLYVELPTYIRATVDIGFKFAEFFTGTLIPTFAGAAMAIVPFANGVISFINTIGHATDRLYSLMDPFGIVRKRAGVTPYQDIGFVDSDGSFQKRMLNMSLQAGVWNGSIAQNHRAALGFFDNTFKDEDYRNRQWMAAQPQRIQVEGAVNLKASVDHEANLSFQDAVVHLTAKQWGRAAERGGV